MRTERPKPEVALSGVKLYMMSTVPAAAAGTGIGVEAPALMAPLGAPLNVALWSLAYSGAREETSCSLFGSQCRSRISEMAEGRLVTQAAVISLPLSVSGSGPSLPEAAQPYEPVTVGGFLSSVMVMISFFES